MLLVRTGHRQTTGLLLGLLIAAVLFVGGFLMAATAIPRAAATPV